MSNIFSIWPPGYYPLYNVFDPDSIQMLPIPVELLKGGEAIGWNRELSPVVKQFIASLYPRKAMR